MKSPPSITFATAPMVQVAHLGTPVPRVQQDLAVQRVQTEQRERLEATAPTARLERPDQTEQQERLEATAQMAQMAPMVQMASILLCPLRLSPLVLSIVCMAAQRLVQDLTSTQTTHLTPLKSRQPHTFAQEPLGHKARKVMRVRVSPASRLMPTSTI